MAQESSNLLCKFSYLNHLTGSNEREAESDIKSLQDQRHKHLKEVDAPIFPHFIYMQGIFYIKMHQTPNTAFYVKYCSFLFEIQVAALHVKELISRLTLKDIKLSLL